MCGICGFMSPKSLSHSELRRMNDSMVHRGPDDEGVEIINNINGYCVGLAHRRLSILDLSNKGHQPMFDSSRKVGIVFNGEIYNFKEIREELSEYPFQSNCDTEVIIAAYLRWGISCVSHFNGMFAFAIFDERNGNLYLARDRMGKKPLYYWLNGGGIIFASELKSIMLYPDFERDVNRDILQRFLFQRYIKAPDTIFKNVYQVEPGSIATFSQGCLEIQKYWDIYTEYKNGLKNLITDIEDAKDMLIKTLTVSVKRRLISDVPLGAFLSGGFDSSLVTAIAQSISATPIKTFSIGMNDNHLNEAEFAKQVSVYLGTDHEELYIDENDMLDMLSDLPKYYDEPFADSSQIPTMLVSMLARKSVTVTLSGDGGDELFCGYSSYGLQSLAQKLDLAGGILYGIGRLGTERYRIGNLYSARIKAITENRDRRFKTQFGGNEYVKQIKRMLPDSIVYKEAKYEYEQQYDVDNWQIRRMLLDMDTYLPSDILTKVDRASMKYSLEARCPMLDVDFIRNSFRIPQKFKYHNGELKYILKQMAYQYIPRELLDRPKQGFSIPTDKWMRGKLREKIQYYSEKEFLKKQGIFEPEFTSAIISDYLKNGDKGAGTGMNYSRICWPFFVFQQWYEEYVS